MIGKTPAHYEITSQIGQGGMGEVYQAKDITLPYHPLQPENVQFAFPSSNRHLPQVIH
jgi:serine/threonine protein kinase